LAKSSESFEVIGISEGNLPFLTELCRAYRYQMKDTDMGALLIPLPDAEWIGPV
jgi:hypothetical protein